MAASGLRASSSAGPRFGSHGGGRNIGLTALADPDHEALTRTRLVHVDQRYLRADTIASANAALIEAHSTLGVAMLLGAPHADDLRPRPRHLLMTDDALSRGGLFEIEERVVPGPPGAPDLFLLIRRPADVAAPRPVVYLTHPWKIVRAN